MDDSPMQEMSGMDCGETRRSPVITTARRKELMTLANKLAEEVERLTKPHERCLLRRMTEMLVERE